jgi:hypothetical protein
MKTDFIREIKIDDTGRLCITPEKEDFSFIYRSAMEVHWDAKEKFLYSPKPREWSYFDWYLQIIAAAKDEYGCALSVNKSTMWQNVPDFLKQQIKSYTK